MNASDAASVSDRFPEEPNVDDAPSRATTPSGSSGERSAASVRQPPVRLCCMQRHDGPVCPDGKVMCCLCFGRFAVEDLNVSYGTPEDVCRDCAAREAEARV